MMDNYADAPVSITELRSDRTEKACDWTPRDCLISTLREIDGGKLKASQIYIITATKGNGDALDVRRSTAGPMTELELRGLLAGEMFKRVHDI